MDFICADSTAVTRPSAADESAFAAIGFTSTQSASFFATSNADCRALTSKPSTLSRSSVMIDLSRRSKVDLLKVDCVEFADEHDPLLVVLARVDAAAGRRLLRRSAACRTACRRST